MPATGDSLNSSDRRRLYVFVILVLAILVIAAGHLFLIDGLTAIQFGLPMWLWIQVAVIALLLVLAWVATGLVPETETEKTQRGGSSR